MPALAHTNPCLVSLMMRSPRRRRMRTDSASTSGLWLSGSAGSIATSWFSALDTIFWVTTTTSPSARAVSSPAAAAAAMIAGQVVARSDLADAVDPEHLQPAHDAPGPLSGASPSHDPGQGRGPLGAGHDRSARRRSAAPSASTASARSASASSMTSVRGQLGVDAGHAHDRGLVAQLGQQAVGRALEGGAGDDRATRPPRRRGGRPRRRGRRGRPAPGRSTRWGSTGRSPRASAPAIASSTPGAGAAASTPVEPHGRARRRRAGAARSTPGSRSRRRPSTVTRVRTGVVGHREQPQRRAPRRRRSRR